MMVVMMGILTPACGFAEETPGRNERIRARLRGFGATVSAHIIDEKIHDYFLGVRGRDGIDRCLELATQLSPVVSTSIENEGVTKLESFRVLRHLSIDGAAYNDDAAEAIASLYWLKWLSIENTNVTYEGFKTLSRLRNLTSLRISGTPLRGRLRPLRVMGKDLRILNLSNSRIGDGDCQYILTAGGLRSLDISCTNVGDSGLLALRGLKSLRKLNLHHTKVTSDSAEAIAGFSNLRILVISGNGINEDELREIVSRSTVEFVCVDRKYMTLDLRNRNDQKVQVDASFVKCRSE